MSGSWYLWIKAFHIISVIAWMAAMLYLPRLFVYHAAAARGSEIDIALRTMERRLLRAIMNPAMIATIVFGGWLLYLGWPGAISQGWMHVKLVGVAVLLVLHHLFASWRKRLERGENRRSPRFYRIVNESVTLAMIVIVVMAIVKPF